MKIFTIFDRKLLKFILVGIINTVVGATIIFSLYNMTHLGYWISSAFGYIFTTILSFFLNKYFTFGVKQWSFFMVVTFIMTIVFSYLIAYGLSKQIINIVLINYPIRIRENVAILTGMSLFAGLNYLGQRLLVFKKGKNQ